MVLRATWWLKIAREDRLILALLVVTVVMGWGVARLVEFKLGVEVVHGMEVVYNIRGRLWHSGQTQVSLFCRDLILTIV